MKCETCPIRDECDKEKLQLALSGCPLIECARIIAHRKDKKQKSKSDKLQDALSIIHGFGGEGFSIRDFQRKCAPRKSYNYAKEILDGLVAAGILSVKKIRRNRNLYTPT